MQRRVVITSIGVISSLGFTLEEILNNLKNENTSFEKSIFDDEVAVSPINGFDVKDFAGHFKDKRYLNRGAQFCVASAIEAVKKAGIAKKSLAEAGLFLGTGPNLDIGGEFPDVKEGEIDRKDLMALWMLKFLPNTAASVIAILAGIHGENQTLTTACSASLQAIGEAFRKIKNGYIDLAFAGGGDSRLSKSSILAYKKAHVLCDGTGKPERASRPFDRSRNGFVPGEGGAFFLLEELQHAQKRGAVIYGEICGYGASIDGYSMTAPEPEGIWAEGSVNAALQEAGLAPSDINVISSHGTGTLLNDSMEADLIDRVYGKRSPFIIAVKSWIGHIAAACGAVELAICLACMKYSYLPKIKNLDEPCHAGLNFVREEQSYPIRNILLENFGFGGQNSVLIIKNIVTL
ncbi:MAG: beta-ketoacyl-[acyl-carrier-protein] synthase family protein [Proteobacteria bacterium]|nr:beta-ketoacyl-[acyl-carrier-protein] synthase family protein [Pseudomonadota bacterium]MBU4286890.1 beta-ketoacyl-[acyl-carrier-protein] synthase family protein [Pseudomonadota bacterium]MBU4415009.1 beta-ketoacyl-[acyl-carrier-protein] synthase family protein [Pseudomonadota bacterium]MCG2758578.1 beta-ketoacyl-[acyl-carrier-protein] synthase family protein [Desulfobacteraceae bacterium]